jgi:hypothetical protein
LYAAIRALVDLFVIILLKEKGEYPIGKRRFFPSVPNYFLLQMFDKCATGNKPNDDSKHGNKAIYENKKVRRVCCFFS